MHLVVTGTHTVTAPSVLHLYDRTELDQGQLSVLRAPDVSAPLDFYMLRCVRVIIPLVRTTAQEDRGACCDSDGEDDDYNRLQQFRHFNIVAQALSFFEKITCQTQRHNTRMQRLVPRPRFLVAVVATPARDGSYLPPVAGSSP